MANKKNLFKGIDEQDRNNPAADYVTQTPGEDKPKRELKTERIQLVIQPSLIKDIDLLADMDRMSRSKMICKACEELLERRADDLKKAKAFFGEK